MVWYSMVWYGIVWYGMVWYGIVWYGMAYCIVGINVLSVFIRNGTMISLCIISEKR